MEPDEFHDTGNAWVALGAGVAVATGLGILALVNSTSLVAWGLTILGIPTLYYFWPVDAATYHRRAVERREEEEAEMQHALSGKPLQDVELQKHGFGLTLSQLFRHWRLQQSMKRNLSQLQKGKLSVLKEIASTQEKAIEIDRLRFWNPLPPKVTIVMPISTELKDFGVEALARRSRYSTIEVKMPPQPPSPVPEIVVSAGNLGVLGPLPFDWARRVSPYLEAGGNLRSRLVRVYSPPKGPTGDVWIELEISPDVMK
jgi:hypothetical protein